MRMTYYGGKQKLANSCRTVRQNTLKIAEEIPEEKYSFSMAASAARQANAAAAPQR